MAKSIPTEADLGLVPTEEEMSTSVASAGEIDDDVSLTDDEPEQQAAAEKPGDPAKEPGKPDEGTKTVDLRALQEARSEAREAKQRAAVLEQRWNEFLASRQAQNQPQQPAQEPPKWAQDPMAAGEWTQQQLIAMQQAAEAREREAAETSQRETAFQETFARVDAEFTAAAQTDPTVREAYNAVRESQGKELLALGYTIPQAQAELARIERAHIEYVAANGLNIADHIRQLAAVRGWQPKPAQPPVQKTDVAAVAAAQQRHQSLSDAPGGESVQPLDAKSLAKMSEKEFRAWMMSNKANESKFEEIMGR